MIRRFGGRTLGWALVAIAALGLAVPLAAEDSTTAGTQKGEWRYWGGDEGSSRYSPLDQINAENFGDLEIAWRWKADNYGPSVDYIYRATPIYVNEKLYTVAGQRRTVLCIDPATGEPGHDTWEGDSWKYTGNISAWAPLSADSDRGLVFIPTDTPTNDYYGGDRLGDNLYGTSLIALDVRTGKKKWHFQMVHHDIWNYDNPDAPHVLDVNIDGKRTPIVIQATKQGWAYTFNRETGEPIWPIEERVVASSDIPRERTAPTQPFVTKPAAFEHQGITEEDLIDFTPEIKAEAIEIAKRYRMGPLFTPPALYDASDGTGGAFSVPGAWGGVNIPGGASVDPETGIMYVATVRGYSIYAMEPGENQGSTAGYVSRSGGFAQVQGLPLLKPPWSSIVAIDMNTGEHLWRTPNGDTPDRVKNHKALQGVDIPRTGKTGAHPTILTTKSLLIYGEGRGGSALLHALNKKTGEEIAEVEIPAPTNTAPMTYMHEGRQYIVLSVAGRGHAAEHVVLALPEE